MIKNNRAILHSNVRALSVQGSWVMIRPEDIQKLIIADLRRIKFQFYYLGVSGLVSANIAVRGILLRATGIAHARGQNTFQVPESFLHAPETSRTECRF